MSHSVVNIAFHADDLGLNASVNAEIERLLAEGGLASLSMMANAPATEAAAEIVRRSPTVPIYLHFNLTEGRPVAPSSILGRLVDERGELLGLRRLLTALLRGRIPPEAVEMELTAQLDRLAGLDVGVTGIDTHHHVHAFSPVSEVVHRVAAARGLTLGRRYGALQTHTLTGSSKKAVTALAARVTAWHSQHSFALPASWKDDTGRPFSVASWERLPANAVRRDATIVCHPGNGCDLPTPVQPGAR